MRTTLAVAVAAALAGTVGIPAASADQADEVTLTADAIVRERGIAAAARARGQEPAKLARARAEMVRMSAQRGVTYALTDVDAFEVGDLVVTLPTAAVANRVSVSRGEDGQLAAEADITNDVGVAGHQGLGQASWATGTSGCYTITITNAATMQTCWYKKKMLDDGDGSFDYYSYRRKAWGQPASISGKDWSVTGMVVRSYPTSGTAANFKGVIARKPGSDFTGNCDTLPFDLSLGYKGASIGFNFMDCDKYDVTFGTKFGDYSNYFKQGAVFSGGNREVAYHEITKVSQGASAVWNDYQRLETARWTYPAKTCASTNGNKTCSP